MADFLQLSVGALNVGRRVMTVYHYLFRRRDGKKGCRGGLANRLLVLPNPAHK